MNRKEIQKIETELETLTARRAAIAADLASATEAATAATEAIIGGAGATASLINAGGIKAVLQAAYDGIVAKIKPLESKLDAAKEAAGQAERAENYEAALKAYDAQTVEMARRIKEFATGNAAEIAAFAAAQSAVGHCEREMIRAGERRHEQTGALQFRRDCGDVRPILKHLDDFLNSKTYVTLSSPAAPVHAQDLSKAGID
jgi:chromosome segregation ATPase